MSVRGAYDARWRSSNGFENLSTAESWLQVELYRLDTLDDQPIRVGRAPVFVYQREGTDELAANFGEELSATFVAGASYQARLTLELYSRGLLFYIDFGSPGSGYGARYTSIEVCLDSPPDDSALRMGFDNADRRDIELRLYQRECLPTLWLPAAQGGRLELAHALVQDLIGRAEASGARGVNLPVARARLASAEAATADGDYQRACRSLSESIKSLTTP